LTALVHRAEGGGREVSMQVMLSLAMSIRRWLELGQPAGMPEGSSTS